MTTQNFWRGGTLAAGAAAAFMAAGLAGAWAQDQAAVDHSKMDHGGADHAAHGAAAPSSAQWADPGKGATTAKPEAATPAKADGEKADDHAAHHGGDAGVAPSSATGGAHGGPSGGGMMSGGMMSGGMGAMMGGGSSHGGMGGMMQHMLCGFTEHLEGRLAYLKAELKLTDTQLSAWNGFADAWRSAAQKATAKCGALDERMDHAKPPVLSKLQMMESHMADHLDVLRAQKAAIEPLFTSLSEEQRKIANEALTTVLKVGMSGMDGGGMMGGMGQGGGHGGGQH